MRNKALLIVTSLLISTAVFFLASFITYTIACAVSPPYFVDENGERHGLMPMGQVFLGIIFGLVLGIVSLFISYKKLKKS